MRQLVKIIASGFYFGFSPVAPGTAGSLWAVLIYILLKPYPVVFMLVTAVLFLAGFAVSGRAEKIFKEKDSRRIVIDEIASMCLVCLFIKPSWFMLILGFSLFRFFDIIKPPPAGRLAKLPGAPGIMLDDIVACVYTVIVMMFIYALDASGIFPMPYI